MDVAVAQARAIAVADTALKDSSVLAEAKSKQGSKEKELKKADHKLPKIKLGGYYKNLFVSSKTLSTAEGCYYDLQRLRLEFNTDIMPRLKGNLVWDNEIILNDFSNTPDFDLIRNKNQKQLAFWDADDAYMDKKHIYGRTSLYRAYLKYDDPSLQVVIGKQKVDWGRCRFWSPIDLFNPVNPLDIERDERLGVDAANAEFSLGRSSNLNLVYAPRKTFDESSLGAKLFHPLGNYDIFLIGGEFKKDEIIGGAFDGYIGDAGFRGESTFTHADSGRDYFRCVIGADYNFPNKLYLLGEYFYNGGAQDGNFSEFVSSYEYASEVLTQKKHFLGIMATYEITPLLKFADYNIYDFEGRSFFFNPEFTYNAITNLDLSLGTQVFTGGDDSEFGPYHNTYYFQLQYFF